MPKAIDLDTSYGWLTPLSRSSRQGYILCRCRCGTKKEVRSDHLMSGRTVSCGCYHKKAASERASNMHKANTTHGMSKTRAHSIWFGMKGRCLNPNNQAFEYYGGRGITVCDRWLESFQNFLDDMGEPPEGYTLERINNDFGYSPENCSWEPRIVQQNNRRVCRKITYKGETKTVSQWARILGIPRNTLYQRLNYGWDMERVFSEPNTRHKQRPTHCKRGHELTEDNVYWQGNSRSCRACIKLRNGG